MFTTPPTSAARIGTGHGGAPLVAVFVLVCAINTFAVQIGVSFSAGVSLLTGFGAVICLAWIALKYFNDGDRFSLRLIWPLLAALAWCSMFPAINDWAASTSPILFEAARGLGQDVPARFMPWWGTGWFKLAGLAIIVAAWLVQRFREQESY